MADSAVTKDPRPRPRVLTSKIDLPPTRDPRPRPSVGLDLASGPTRSTQDLKPQRSPTNFPASYQPHLEISLPSPVTPSEGCGQIVAVDPRSAGRDWLTREDLRKLPRIPKIKCDAKATPASASGLKPKPMFATFTPIASTPMTPPLSPLDLQQRHNSFDSGISTRPCTFPSAIQTETAVPMIITQQRPFFPQKSIGPNSRQETPINQLFCSESSQALSLSITPPLTPTKDSTSHSLSRIFNSPLEPTTSSPMTRQEDYSDTQERDRVDIPWGRNSGVQSTLKPETKEINAPLGKAQNKTPDFRDTSPLKNSRDISSQPQISSPLARTVTDANGKTVNQRVADPLPAPTTSHQQTRSPKEFNMDSYNSCDCRSNSGEDCMCCRILKGAFEFCKRVDSIMKER